MALVLELISWALLLAGSAFAVIGGIGMLRLPDLYTRMHGASVTDTMGAGLILIGLMIQAGLGLIAVKLILILVFILFTSPVASHALAKAARGSGLEPELKGGEKPFKT
jgi:multicomponent Na+:H+ antiporter subunit G